VDLKAGKGRAIEQSRLYCGIFESPLGPIHGIFIQKGSKGPDPVAGVHLERPRMRIARAPGVFMEQMAAYFEGTLREFSLEVVFTSGTEFERSVWLALRQIPFGETRSYKWLAEAVGSPMASRAVGQALAKNPVPIILPCHRIIESGGHLGGYSSGADIKRRLIALEYYQGR
jgi:O-6-methylguanine DNA methyltransferase